MSTRKNETDGSFVLKAGEDNLRFTRDLLVENEALRLLVAGLRTEKLELLGRAQAAEPLIAELSQLREEQSRLRREQEEWQKQISETATENRRFADGYMAVEKRHSDLMNLYVASYRLHGTIDRAEVIGAIQEIVANLVGCEENAIFEVSPAGDVMRLVASVGIDADAFAAVPVGEGIIGRTAKTGDIFVTDGEGADSETNPEGLTACVPLKLNGQVIGAIALFRMLPQKPALEGVDHEMFDLLATHAATALYCSGLHAAHGSVSASRPC